MKKTLKTIEAVRLHNELSTLVEDNKRRMSGAVAYTIYRIFKQLNTIEQDYEEMQRKKIISMQEEGKTKDVESENGTSIQVDKEHLPELIEYMNEIAVSPVDIEYSPISEEDFNKTLALCDLSIPEISALETFLDIKEKE
jgi:hypothetical protein